VPEIAEGIVEIKGIAREAGDRTKIAVASTDEKVDCVGACVGMRGTRVKNIVRELHGEKVDIIRWHEDVKAFIAAALSPAKINEIQPSPEGKQALVLVDDDQLSLAIGKRGQNVRLASKLTGWQLDIKSTSQPTRVDRPLRELPGVGPLLEQRLGEAGVTTVQELAAKTVAGLTAIKGIGEKTAERLLESAKAALAPSAEAASEDAAPVSESSTTPAAEEPTQPAGEPTQPAGEPDVPAAPPQPSESEPPSDATP
jgi:N utilization substance protein A